MAPLGDTHPFELRELLGSGAPLNAAAETLSGTGYLEQEFELRGQASRYRMTDSGSDAERIDGGHAYCTRLLVRRPSAAVGFNGVAVVEWLNVSTGQDLDFVYAATRELIVRKGYAWIGVSAQRVGVERLVQWNPRRYGALTVAAALDDPTTGLPLDPAHAFTGAAGGDVLCWDIFSQVAQAIRAESGRVLGSAEPRMLVASGESQSAFRLSRYFNSIQPLHGLYDGFLLYDRGGPHLLRDDLKAKLIGMGTDFFAEYAGSAPPDTSNQRWWELAGASHVSLAEMRDYVDPQVLRDQTQQLNGQPVTLSEVLAQGQAGGTYPLWSRVPNGDLMKAALHALTRWALEGVKPPRAERLCVDAAGCLISDPLSGTTGGIRYAALQVPTAENVGSAPTGPKLAGYHRDFTAEEMSARYGSPAAYRGQVDAAVEANLREGFLLAEEALRVMREARQVDF